MTMEPLFVDTVQTLAGLIDALPVQDDGKLVLYLDLEGNNLSRHGTISILTLLFEAENTVYLVDITTLKDKAFTTGGSDGRTLKSILESDGLTKVFFDIRNDSDALFALYGIRVAGIQDLQLMELASRQFSRRCVNGLGKCIENDAGLGYSQRQIWKTVKDRGRNLFAPECGGSYAVFDARPLSEEMKKYCAQDVTLMPTLREKYCEKLCDAWWARIDEETAARITLSHSMTYSGKGRHMALGPTSWLTWCPSPAEVLVRTRYNGTTAPTAPEACAPSNSQSQLHSPPGVVQMAPAELLRRNTMRQGTGLGYHDESDEEAYDTSHHSGNRGYVSDLDASHSEDDEPRDMTACDSECGYCGRCMY